jgi:Flp pilus assembly protein TadG
MKSEAVQRRKSERGETLVEFALASTIFFMTIFGTVEFGLAVWQYNIMADLAQEGARYATVHGKNSSTPASSGDVQTYVRARALGMGSSVTVTASPAPSSLDAGDTVTVAVSKPFRPLTGFVPNTTLTLGSTAKMIVAR